MKNNKLRLISTDGKSVFFSSSGSKDATILLPTEKDNFEFITRDEAERYVVREVLGLSGDVILPQPNITAPSNNAIGYSGGFTLENNFPTLASKNGKISVIYQVADSEDFNNIIFTIVKETNRGSELSSVLNVPSSELINKGIVGSSSKKDTRYFLRCKIVYANVSSIWSNVVVFRYASNAYVAPVINSIEIDTDPILGKDEILRLPGTATIKTTGYFVAVGTLPEPNSVNVEVSNGTYKKVYKVPYNSKDIKFLPEFTDDASKVTSDETFKVIPGVEYNVKINFETIDATGVLITSPWSNVKTLRFELPKLRLGKIEIIQNADNILTAPTVGVDGVYIDYDYADVKSNGSPYLDKDNTIKDTRRVKVTFNVYNTEGALFVTRTTGIPLWCFNSKNIKDYGYTGCLITLNDALFSISQTYSLTVTATLEGNSSGISLAEDTKTKEFQIKGNTITVPTDNLDRVIATYPSTGSKKFGYFGEIVGEYTASGKPNVIMPDVRFTGVYKEGKPYKKYDEVIYNNELYLCIKDIPGARTTPDQDTTNFAKITFDNIRTHYKSGLPSYKWLAKEIGLPLAYPFSKKTNGEVVAEDVCSRLLNSTEGWIKLHNYAKQILYVAKKPIASNISYRELRRRFLTGSYTRTIRIGLNYYTVRLLEVSPTDVIDEIEKTESNTINKDNIQNEKELYKNIFRNLFTYQMEDLGLIKDDNFTYQHKSKVKTYKKVDSYGSVNILTEETNIEPENYDDNGPTYFYRPVLELVRETHLPFRKSKPLPGSLNQGDVVGSWLDYDKWSDTGYYGEVSSNILFTPEELKKLFNLTGLTNLPNDIRYHKFYWHGLAIYIPNKPIGLLPIPHLNQLVENDIIYGTDSNKHILFNNSKWIMSLPNFSPSYYINYSKREGDVTPTNNHIDIGSVIFDLVYRLITNPGYDENKYPVLKKFSTTLDTEFNTVNGFLIKDIVIGNFNREGIKVNTTEEACKYVDIGRGLSLTNPNILAKVDVDDIGEFEKYSNLWPILITEVADKNQDFYYNNVGTPIPHYEQRTAYINRYTVVPVEVEREVVVNEPIEKEIEVKYQVEKKIETGNYVFSETDRNISDTYGLVIFYAKKTDNCYITKPLYHSDSLNVVNFLNGLGVKFSSKYPNIDTYMLQSIITNGSTSKIVAEAIPINKFFRESREIKTYLKRLLREGLKIGSLKNLASNIVNTSTDKKKPYGMMHGKISSSYLYFGIPEWYNLFETVDKGTMNYDPMITIDKTGGLDNSWIKLPDINNTMITIPLLNTYFKYEDYSLEGREELIDKIIPYIINRDYSNVTVDTVDSIKDEIKKNYIFSIVGAELNNLCILPDNGIVYGDAITPSFIQPAPEHRMTPYFTPVGGVSKKVLDLFNPKKDYIIKIVEETRKETILVDNFVTKKYKETVFEERIERIQVTYPVVTYP